MLEHLSEGARILIFLACACAIIMIIVGIYEHSTLSERDPEDNLKDYFGDGQ